MTSLVFVQLFRKKFIFHLYGNIEGRFWGLPVTSSMTSSPWKYFSCIIWDDLSISDGKLKLQWIFQKFSKWRNFRAGANFFVESVTGSWTHHQKSQEHALHFELLIDVLAQILGKLWQFQNLTYFLTWWRHLWCHQHQKVYGSSRKHICAKFVVDCLNGAACIASITDRQTHKPTNAHTCQYWKFWQVKRSRLLKFIPKEDQNVHIVQSQYRGCWWAEDAVS